LYFGNGLYAGNILLKNRGGEVYIKIVSTRDIDERIVTPEIELEELDEIATSHLKNSSSCDKNVQTRAVDAIAIDNIQSHEVHEVIPYGNICVWTTLTKR